MHGLAYQDSLNPVSVDNNGSEDSTEWAGKHSLYAEPVLGLYYPHSAIFATIVAHASWIQAGMGRLPMHRFCCVDIP